MIDGRLREGGRCPWAPHSGLRPGPIVENDDSDQTQHSQWSREWKVIVAGVVRHGAMASGARWLIYDPKTAADNGAPFRRRRGITGAAHALHVRLRRRGDGATCWA